MPDSRVSALSCSLQTMRAIAVASLLGLAAPAVAFLKAPGLQRQLSTRAAGRQGVMVMARKPFIAGNWKLNPATMDEAVSLAKAVSSDWWWWWSCAVARLREGARSVTGDSDPCPPIHVIPSC